MRGGVKTKESETLLLLKGGVPEGGGGRRKHKVLIYRVP